MERGHIKDRSVHGPLFNLLLNFIGSKLSDTNDKLKHRFWAHKDSDEIHFFKPRLFNWKAHSSMNLAHRQQQSITNVLARAWCYHNPTVINLVKKIPDNNSTLVIEELYGNKVLSISKLLLGIKGLAEDSKSLSLLIALIGIKTLTRNSSTHNLKPEFKRS